MKGAANGEEVPRSVDTQPLEPTGPEVRPSVRPGLPAAFRRPLALTVAQEAARGGDAVGQATVAAPAPGA